MTAGVTQETLHFLPGAMRPTHPHFRLPLSEYVSQTQPASSKVHLLDEFADKGRFDELKELVQDKLLDPRATAGDKRGFLSGSSASLDFLVPLFSHDSIWWLHHLELIPHSARTSDAMELQTAPDDGRQLSLPVLPDPIVLPGEQDAFALLVDAMTRVPGLSADLQDDHASTRASLMMSWLTNLSAALDAPDASSWPLPEVMSLLLRARTQWIGATGAAGRHRDACQSVLNGLLVTALHPALMKALDPQQAAQWISMIGAWCSDLHIRRSDALTLLRDTLGRLNDLQPRRALLIVLQPSLRVTTAGELPNHVELLNVLLDRTALRLPQQQAARWIEMLATACRPIELSARQAFDVLKAVVPALGDVPGLPALMAWLWPDVQYEAFEPDFKEAWAWLAAHPSAIEALPATKARTMERRLDCLLCAQPWSGASDAFKRAFDKQCTEAIEMGAQRGAFPPYAHLLRREAPRRSSPRRSPPRGTSMPGCARTGKRSRPEPAAAIPTPASTRPGTEEPDVFRQVEAAVAGGGKAVLDEALRRLATLDPPHARETLERVLNNLPIAGPGVSPRLAAAYGKTLRRWLVALHRHVGVRLAAGNAAEVQALRVLLDNAWQQTIGKHREVLAREVPDACGAILRSFLAVALHPGMLAGAAVEAWLATIARWGGTDTLPPDDARRLLAQALPQLAGLRARQAVLALLLPTDRAWGDAAQAVGLLTVQLDGHLLADLAHDAKVWLETVRQRCPSFAPSSADGLSLLEEAGAAGMASLQAWQVLLSWLWPFVHAQAHEAGGSHRAWQWLAQQPVRITALQRVPPDMGAQCLIDLSSGLLSSRPELMPMLEALREVVIDQWTRGLLSAAVRQEVEHWVRGVQAEQYAENARRANMSFMALHLNQAGSGPSIVLPTSELPAALRRSKFFVAPRASFEMSEAPVIREMNARELEREFAGRNERPSRTWAESGEQPPPTDATESVILELED